MDGGSAGPTLGQLDAVLFFQCILTYPGITGVGAVLAVLWVKGQGK